MILVSYPDESVLYRILMNVVQARKVRTFVRKFGIPEVKPHRSPDGAVESIQVASRVSVKVR
jgi:hypothetical protein